MAKVRRRSALYVADCRDLIPRLGLFDLIFADPPFNMGRDYDTWDDQLSDEAYGEFTRAWVSRCARAMRPSGSLWVNVPDACIPPVLAAADDAGLPLHQWCIWHYRFGQYTPSRFTPSKTHALWFRTSRGEPKWRPDDVKVQSVRQQMGDPRAKADGRPPLDVWGFEPFWGRVQGNNKERRPGHDNQLPEAYLERVIRCCTDRRDRVLDPFLGSGTTGVVAKSLGRRFVGVDISAEYVRSARRRMAEGAVRVRQTNRIQ